MSILKQYNYFKLIIIAIVLYGVVMLGLQYFSNLALYNTFTPDFSTYIEAAQHLFYDAKPHTIRPVGIAAFVSTPLYFGLSLKQLPNTVWLIQFALWLLQIVIIYKTATLLSNSKIAFIVALLFVINFSNMLHTTVILSETLCSFLLCCVMYYLVMFFLHKQNYLAYASTILCLAALVRPTFLYSSILLSIMAILYFIKGKQFFGLCISLIGIALINIQCVKMQKQFGNYTVSYINKAALISYLDVRAKQYKNNTSYAQEIEIINKQVQNKTPSQISDMAVQDFKEQIKTNTFNLVHAYFFNLLENSTMGCSIAKDMRSQEALSVKVTSKIIRFMSKLQNTIYSLCVLLFFPIWFFKYFKRLKKQMQYLFIGLWFICIYTILLSAFSFYQHDRFHIIVVPQVLILITMAWQTTLATKPLIRKAS